MSAPEEFEKLFKIPPILQKDRFKFCKIKGKGPFETKWQENGYDYDDRELGGHIANGDNYGVIAVPGVVAIVDADSKDIARYCERYLPKTLTVRSGGAEHKRHFYLKVTGNGENRRFSIDKENGKLDFQYDETCVVGPGCIHPATKNVYTIIVNADIATITFSKLMKILNNFYERDMLDPRNIIDITQLKQRAGTHEYFGPHPIHGSETGNNFHINLKTGMWFCHRHRTGGGPQKLLAMMKKYIKCEEANEPLSVDTIRNLGMDEEPYEISAGVMKILKNKKLFKLIIVEFHKTHVGDDKELGCCLSSVLSSRLSPDDRLSVKIRGDTSVGKTNLVKTVIRPIPPEWYMYVTRATRASLEELARFFELIIQLEKITIKGGEDINEAIKQLSEDGMRITKMELDENKKFVMHDSGFISRKSVIDTSTQKETNLEVANRALIVYINETSEKLNASYNLICNKASSESIEDGNTLHKHNWITDVLMGLERFDKIVIPFAKRIPVKIDSPRKQRDFKRFLNIVRTITFLYQYQRKSYKNNGKRFLESAEDDFKIAAIISHGAFVRSISEKTPNVEKLLNLLDGNKIYKQGLAEIGDDNEDWVLRSDAQKALGYGSRDTFKKVIDDASAFIETYRKHRYSPLVYIRSSNSSSNGVYHTLLTGSELLPKVGPNPVEEST